MSPKLALLIGCEYLGTPNELLGCQTDVKNMYGLLTQNLGYSANDILVLTESNDIKPTSDNILKGIEYLAQTAKKKNSHEAVIYFSGHGTQVRDDKSEEKDGLDEVLVPLDYTNGYIRDDTLHQYLGLFPIKCQTMCIFDCCNSGTVGDLEYTYYYDLLKDTTQVVKSARSPLPNSVFSISGCKDDQTSSVVLTDRGWNSALTTCLIEIFKKHQYEITFHQLDKELNRYMKQHDLSQRPVLSSSWPKQPGSLISLTRPQLMLPPLSQEQRDERLIMRYLQDSLASF